MSQQSHIARGGTKHEATTALLVRKAQCNWPQHTHGCVRLIQPKEQISPRSTAYRVEQRNLSVFIRAGAWIK
uniref:Uncharacterized protein n=1 Tax=Leersia perrieri TaxID=77586 RepID=A0A0D9VKM0_9ORYZ